MEKYRASSDQVKVALNFHMQLLSRSKESGPSEGITRASTRRVTLPRVDENATNPRIPIGEPFVALRGIATGGTGDKGSFCKVGCDVNHAAKQTEQSVAVSAVTSLTGRGT